MVCLVWCAFLVLDLGSRAARRISDCTWYSDIGSVSVLIPYGACRVFVYLHLVPYLHVGWPLRSDPSLAYLLATENLIILLFISFLAGSSARFRARETQASLLQLLLQLWE